MKHETFISGLKLGASGGILAPTILAYSEDDFVSAFLDDVGAPDWADRLEQRSVFKDGVTLPELQQPVHRMYHVVVVDARCLTPGLPRLDPAKIASAGMVVRRIREGGEDGWMRKGDMPLGWQAPPAGSLFDEATTYDPKADLRRQKALGKNAKLLRQLDTLPGDGGNASEAELPLFRVPPAVMENTGMTLYYGFLPLSSGEVEPEVDTTPPFSDADVLARLPGLLSASRSGVQLPPISSNVTRADMVRPEENADTVRGRGLRTLKSALTWLAQETGAFNDGAAPGIGNTLNQLTVQGTSETQFFEFLRTCYQAFILQGPDDPTSVQMPDDWPDVTQNQQDDLVTHAVTGMSARWASAAPQTPQYPALALPYRLRCFVRIDDCPGCPPRIVWSRASDDWTIRPWFNGGDGPPRQIEMPALSLNAIKSLKPNITVKVPPELQQHLDRINMPDLMEGKHTKTGIDFGMLCGFSIPIITICAFIILQIFLQLLNIIFFWLPYVRICIPFPKPPSPPPGP